MTRVHEDPQADQMDDIRESRNFWKWLALVSWIFAGVAAMLRMFPLH